MNTVLVLYFLGFVLAHGFGELFIVTGLHNPKIMHWLVTKKFETLQQCVAFQMSDTPHQGLL